MHVHNFACAKRHARIAWDARVGGLTGVHQGCEHLGSGVKDMHARALGWARRRCRLRASAIRMSARALGREWIAARAPLGVPLYLSPTENLCKRFWLGYDFISF